MTFQKPWDGILILIHAQNTQIQQKGSKYLIVFSIMQYVYLTDFALSSDMWLGPFSIFAWRHQMETFSALLAICAGNSPVFGEFPAAQRPVTRSFDVFFYLRLNQRWVNDGEAGDLRRYRAHYDVIVMDRHLCFSGCLFH